MYSGKDEDPWNCAYVEQGAIIARSIRSQIPQSLPTPVAPSKEPDPKNGLEAIACQNQNGSGIHVVDGIPYCMHPHCKCDCQEPAETRKQCTYTKKP